MDRNESINKEIKRLKGIYKNIPNINQAVRLIEHASFLSVVAEEMKDEIIKSEFTTITENASQRFTKSNPLLKDHRETLKSYRDTIKQLDLMLPKEKEDNDDEFDNF